MDEADRASKPVMLASGTIYKFSRQVLQIASRRTTFPPLERTYAHSVKGWKGNTLRRIAWLSANRAMDLASLLRKRGSVFPDARRWAAGLLSLPRERLPDGPWKRRLDAAHPDRHAALAPVPRMREASHRAGTFGRAVSPGCHSTPPCSGPWPPCKGDPLPRGSPFFFP